MQGFGNGTRAEEIRGVADAEVGRFNQAVELQRKYEPFAFVNDQRLLFSLFEGAGQR
jgi:hypothetical protein